MAAAWRKSPATATPQSSNAFRSLSVINGRAARQRRADSASRPRTPNRDTAVNLLVPPLPDQVKRSRALSVRYPFKIKTNSRTLFPKHDAAYCFLMGKLESRLASSRDSRTLAPITSFSASLAKSSSSWIAIFSQFLESSRKSALNCGVPASTANSAQRAACSRHSLGSPGIGRLPAETSVWGAPHTTATPSPALGCGDSTCPPKTKPNRLCGIWVAPARRSCDVYLTII
jgi:hypothetical protein